MKQLKYLIIVALFLFWLVMPILSLEAKNVTNKNGRNWSWENQTPVQILGEVKESVTENPWERVQQTDLDQTSSKYDACEWIAPDPRYTITRTLCHVKENIKDYLQYAMYIWLTAATIFLIRNGFMLVTSTDKQKQMTTFKKNITYVIIWVILLTWFYYILDILIGVVNLFTD